MERNPLSLSLMPIDLAPETPHGSRKSTLRIVSAQDGYQSFWVADGRRDDLFGLAHKLFGARHGAWTDTGEFGWTYPIQGTEDASVQLTEREKRIMACLVENPNISSDTLAETLEDEPAAIKSAARFLYEHGLVVIENGCYTVRR